MITDKPHFSIITPAYRSESTVAAAISSALAQTDPDWEMIVVDDGSDDATAERARQAACGDSRIRILSQANAGPAVARNTALEHASGTWFVLLDADDRLRPNYLEAQRALIARRPGFSVYATNAWSVYPNGSRHLFWGGRYNRERPIVFSDQIRRNLVNVHATFHRSVYEDIGGFVPGLRAQDYEFWIRAMNAGHRVLMNAEPLVDYHVNDGSLSTDQVIVLSSVVGFIERLAADAPREHRLLMERALPIWRGRLAIARMQEEMLDGRYAGARTTFLRNARYLPDWRKIPVGGALVLANPRWYRTILLRRFERSRALRDT